jgi:hypothetical protein
VAAWPATVAARDRIKRTPTLGLAGATKHLTQHPHAAPPACKEELGSRSTPFQFTPTSARRSMLAPRLPRSCPPVLLHSVSFMSMHATRFLQARRWPRSQMPCRPGTFLAGLLEGRAGATCEWPQETPKQSSSRVSQLNRASVSKGRPGPLVFRAEFGPGCSDLRCRFTINLANARQDKYSDLPCGLVP